MSTNSKSNVLVFVIIIIISVLFISCGNSGSKSAAATANSDSQTPAAQEGPAQEVSTGSEPMSKPEVAGSKAVTKPSKPQDQAAVAAKEAELATQKDAEAAKKLEAAKQAEAEKVVQAEIKAQELAKAQEVAKAAELAKVQEAVKAQELIKAKAEAVRVAALDVPNPLIKTPGVLASTSVTVIIEVALREAVIAYTLDGSDPSSSNGQRYTGPLALSSSALLKARAYIPGAKSSGVVSARYTIGEVCASPGASGDGRQDAPLGSVSDAIAKARSMGIDTVKLSAGIFEGSIDIDAPIALSGAWKNDFSSQANVPTILRGKTAGTTSKKAPGYALRVSKKAADAKTKFNRIEFRGPEASYSAGIVVVENAAPSFVDCSSYGGFGSYGYGASVAGNANPSFKSSRLDGGEGATSYGLSVDSAGAEIESSFLLAGTGTVGAYGLAVTDAKVAVVNSVMAGSNANVNYGAAFYNSKDSTLTNCTLVGGSGKDVSGIFISVSNPVIDRCIIQAQGQTKSFGITANYGESAPKQLSATVFLGCSSGIYWDAGTRTALSSLNSSGVLMSADGKPLLRGANEGNSKAAFSLGTAPRYESSSSSAGANIR